MCYLSKKVQEGRTQGYRAVWNHSGRQKGKGRNPGTNTSCDLRQVRVASVSF